ncbi:unnamed protein product [Euphydryas editha]|uniref:Uncharacterized protein n=1 Tax=Euphydryas editha TaxID=104508 RepID=A0AAU9URG6_EUPED|nr:unnamed protein product [Euphydryas editha]
MRTVVEVREGTTGGPGRSQVDGEPTALSLGARGTLGRALLHGLLAPAPAPRHHLYTAPNTGSLPPSPADSGVSDVESSSSGAGSAEELKARLQPPPPATFHTPFLPFYQQHQIATSLQHHVATHPRPPVLVSLDKNTQRIPNEMDLPT